MALQRSRAGDGVVPVRTCQVRLDEEYRFGVGRFGGVDGVQVNRAPDAVLAVGVQVIRQRRRCARTVLRVRVFHFCPVGRCVVAVGDVGPLCHFLRVQHFRRARDVGVGEADIAVVGHLHALFFTGAGLGGIHHDPVCCPCAVDRCRSCILEHGDGLDVIGIQEVGRFHRYPVHDIQRLVAPEGPETAYPDLRGRSGLAVGQDRHTGYPALQLLLHVPGGDGGELAGGHDGNGAGSLALGLDRIPRNDDFVDCDTFCQTDGQVSLLAQGDLLGLVPRVGNFQYIARCSFDGKRTVQIRKSTDRGPLDQNGCPYQRLPRISVQDDAFDLGKNRRCHQ